MAGGNSFRMKCHCKPCEGGGALGGGTAPPHPFDQLFFKCCVNQFYREPGNSQVAIKKQDLSKKNQVPGPSATHRLNMVFYERFTGLLRLVTGNIQILHGLGTVTLTESRCFVRKPVVQGHASENRAFKLQRTIVNFERVQALND